ncbi:BMC domain-containing protein [Raoultella ornithinolytica]|uniref:BMC domain-containing protein n=1 Tax=Raoultella ornithinolytica TaxID=54291 RepID=UPI00301D5865
MKSLGVIETRGLVTAIQAVDAACKAAGVTCIGYRKIGSGLVSVCFEGEISAIHTAIERGVEVAGAAQHVKSLVIARPEPSVVAALSHLKGRPEAKPLANHADMKNAVPAAMEKVEPQTPPSPPAPGEPEDKNAAMKKGKKA